MIVEKLRCSTVSYRMNWRVCNKYKHFNVPESALFGHERFAGDYNGDGTRGFLLYDRDEGERILGKVLGENTKFRYFFSVPRELESAGIRVG